MSICRSWTLSVFLCLFLGLPIFAAGEQTIRIGIDRDNNVSTGCQFDPGTGDLREGIDIVLEVVVNANVSPPIVFSSSYTLCSGDSFGSPTSLGAGWPVGINNGLAGADVVEAAIPVYLLGQTQTVLLDAGIADPRGSDDTSATLTFSAPVPALGTIAFFAFAGLLVLAAIWMMRRHRRSALLVLLGVTLVAASGVNFILDGQIDDWNGTPPLISDPPGDPGSTDATDIVALFACLEGDDRLIFRLDIVDLENDPPMAVEDSVTTLEDVAIAIDVLANDTDPDLDALEVTQVSSPSSGTAVIQVDGSVLYTPNLNTKGSDSFTYTVSDPVGLTDTAQVNVQITPDGDPPIAADDSAVVDEDAIGIILDVLANDTDPDTGDVLTIVSVGMPNNGGNVLINGGTSLAYSPAPDFFGMETFSYTIQDSSGKSDSATVMVVVNNVNDDPNALDDKLAVDEDSTNNTLDVLANDTDAPDVGETLAITALGMLDNGGTAIIAGGGTSVSYTPAPDFFGTEMFTYTIADGNGGSDMATVTVTVNNVDDPVTAEDDSFTAPEDGATDSVDLLANDEAPDGGLAIQSFDATSVEGAVLADNGNGTLSYDPSAVANLQALDDGEMASDSFDYIAVDTDGDDDTATVTVTVEGANDAPSADMVAETVNQNESIVITLSGADIDVETLTFSIATGPTNGSLGAITATGPTSAEVTYTHGNLNADPDSFTYVANDGTVDSPPASVNLTIIPNTPPTANDDGSKLSPIIVQRDSFTDIDVAANDSDSDGVLDLATVVPTLGGLGTTVATGGGIVRYTGNAAAIGSDTFTYTIDDDDGGTSNSASVYVYINDPPVADDDMVAVAAGSTITIPVLTGDTDSDGTIDPTTVSITTDVGSGEGSTMVNPDGTVFYDPGAYVGITSFQYTATDDLGGTSAPATVTINVSPAPMAMDDNYNVFGHTTVSVPASLGLLINDTDDGNIFAVTGTFATDNGGSITINADGSYTYTTPGPGAAAAPTLGGTDTYTYTIEDKLMSPDTATITFTYEKVVWFTDNTNASGTEDGSQADPFNTLADAEASALGGHTFFVFNGDGTSNGQDAGIVLLNGQELIGEIAGLAVDVDGMGPGMPLTIIASGNRPILTNLVGDVITLGDDNFVTGLQLEPQASAGIFAGGKGMRGDGKRTSYSELRRTKQAPVVAKRAGGDTEISDVIVEVQNDFSDGIVFLGQTGDLTLSDITINGPAGMTGFGGLIFDSCFVTATTTNLAVNEMLDSVVLAGNPGSEFAFDGMTVNTSDGLGFLAFLGGTVSIVGASNTITNFSGEGFVLDDVTIGAPGVTLASVDVESCNAGIVLDTVTGGDFLVTGLVQVTDMLEDGIEITNSNLSVTFGGMVDIAMTGDDGIDLTDHMGTIDFQMPITLMNIDDDGIDIQGAEGTITFLSTVTIDGTMDAGIELNGENGGTPAGSISFMDTVDIDNAAFVGVFGFDIHNNISFATLDIESVGVGGMILDGADILGTLSMSQLDINAGAGTSVGLGFVNTSGNVDIDAGTLENVEGEVIGLIESNLTLNFTGMVSQSTADDELLLVDSDDVSTVVFEAGSIFSDIGGEGLQFEDADGSYTFNCPITVMGNDDDGIDISSSSTGSFIFNAAVILETGTGMAVRFAGGLMSLLDFNGGLDIDTTSGVGFLGDSSAGMVTVNGTSTVATTTGNPVEIISTTIGASGVTFASVNSAGGSIQLVDTGSSGTFTISGTGSVDGSGGTLTGGATPLQINGSSAVRYAINNLNIDEFTTIGVEVGATMVGSVFGTLTNMNVTSTQPNTIGISLMGDGNGTGMVYSHRTNITDCSINVDLEGVLLQSLNSTNFATVSTTLSGSDITSVSANAVRGFVNNRSNLCMNANGNVPLSAAMSDFNLEQTASGILTIPQSSIADLQAANDGGAATATTAGIISTNRMCPTIP